MLLLVHDCMQLSMQGVCVRLLAGKPALYRPGLRRAWGLQIVGIGNCTVRRQEAVSQDYTKDEGRWHGGFYTKGFDRAPNSLRSLLRGPGSSLRDGT